MARTDERHLVQSDPETQDYHQEWTRSCTVLVLAGDKKFVDQFGVLDLYGHDQGATVLAEHQIELRDQFQNLLAFQFVHVLGTRGQIQTNRFVIVAVDVVEEHVHLVDLHEEVAALNLVVVGAVERHDLLDEGVESFEIIVAHDPLFHDFCLELTDVLVPPVAYVEHGPLQAILETVVFFLGVLVDGPHGQHRNHVGQTLLEGPLAHRVALVPQDAVVGGEVLQGFGDRGHGSGGSADQVFQHVEGRRH